MDDDSFQRPEFEEEWQSVRSYNALPVSYLSADGGGVEDDGCDTVEVEKTKKKNKKRLSGFGKTIKYQMICCALVVIFVIAVKFISVDIFQGVKSWYYEQLNSNLIITDVFRCFDGRTDEI